MILDALAGQFGQRFQHEKRAQVCLWFDERQEFARLLPLFQTHLAGMRELPFRVLQYDAASGQGQIWLKYQIHKTLEAADPHARNALRFVLYLPLPEERLDGPAANGAPPLDFLAEYRITGVTWRIGGKRPTLFTFLRVSGVALPESQADQRRLYEDGKDSLLAKYVAKFIDSPKVFWTTVLTPELAQSRLVGDLDQTILDVAMGPEAAWQELRDSGLEREFLDSVRERYGFEGPADSPSKWMREFVSVLALTETYVGYGEPPEFPFAAKLPPFAHRSHLVQLLQRWLRDSESRPVWDRWIREVEEEMDLTVWAKDRKGVSFGFPHLVQLRWHEVRTGFDNAVARNSTVMEFFERNEEIIDKEVEYARASGSPVGSWDLMRRLGSFVKACENARKRAESTEPLCDLARIYVDCAGNVEHQHIRIRSDAEEQGLTEATRLADRLYASYTNALNARFFQRLVEAGAVNISGFLPVTERLEQVIWKANGKRAVIIVDAMRFDCALAIKERLHEQQVNVEPLVAVLPTVTPMGMTALMPLSGANLALEIKGNGVHPTVNGRDMSVRSNRLAYLTEFGADCREIGDVESLSAPPKSLRDLLVVFGHEDVDHIGHGEAQTLIRHIDREIDRLARLIRKLHRWGYPRVHVVTDHGFILLDESQLPEEVRCEKDWCLVQKERFALVQSGADLPVSTFAFPWDATVRVAVPPGLAFFKAEKSFSHGGAAVQEIIIPHLQSQMGIETRRIGIEVLLPATELVRTTVKVILRPKTPGETSRATQMGLFSGIGRSLVLDVLRTDSTGKRVSVLAAEPKKVRLEPQDKEHNVTLFFHSAASFRRGETLALDILDAETGEQFPPGATKLTVGRDM